MGSTYRLCGREEEEKYEVQREYIVCIIGILVFMQIVRLFAAHCTLMWLVWCEKDDEFMTFFKKFAWVQVGNFSKGM